MRQLTADTKIKLSQIKALHSLWIEDHKFKDGDVTIRADGTMWKRDHPGKWHQVKESKYAIEMKEKYKEEPFDKEGRHFIKNSQNSIDFGFITKTQAGKMGMRPGPIRLSEGTPGYGLKHAKKHEAQLQRRGYKDVIEFIEDVLNSYTEIKYLGLNNRKRADGSGKQERSFALFRKADVGCVLVEYEKSRYGKDFYTINTASLFNKNNKVKNADVVWP